MLQTGASPVSSFVFAAFVLLSNYFSNVFPPGRTHFARGKQDLISNQKYYIIFFVQIQQQFYSFWNIFILFALPKIDGFA
jgi:hypothetical protein